MFKRTWAIVLAGGEGSRLADLTTTRSGVRVPKQFCSLAGGPSLLRQTIERAADLVPRDRIVVVVSEAHRTWWRDELGDLTADNVLVQPTGRGTAPGILWPALHVARRDPGARVAVLPSDHHVGNESILRLAFGEALDAVAREPERIALLGIAPEPAAVPDTQYGWIVPARRERIGLQPIELFVEKPSLEEARALQARGGLWSSFLFAARVASLLEGFELALPVLHRAFVAESAGRDRESIRALYRDLPSADFSRDVLEKLAARLGVVAVPACEWSDLGTPERVARVIAARAVRRRPMRLSSTWTRNVPDLSLALHARLADAAG